MSLLVAAPTTTSTPQAPPNQRKGDPPQRQGQHSLLARSAIMSSAVSATPTANRPTPHRQSSQDRLAVPPKLTGLVRKTIAEVLYDKLDKPLPAQHRHGGMKDGVGVPLSDTPAASAPPSPRMQVLGNEPVQFQTVADNQFSPALRRDSGTSTPRIRPTTLDIPGLTKSKFSPDGRIAQQDIGAKLVIVMVGLPARGKSYITKKIARYMNWTQHSTKIFNVGERRRVAAGGARRMSQGTEDAANEKQSTLGHGASIHTGAPNGMIEQGDQPAAPVSAAKILINGTAPNEPPSIELAQLNVGEKEQGQTDSGDNAAKNQTDETWNLGPPMSELTKVSTLEDLSSMEAMDQSADFFDPKNVRANMIREQAAMSTLDDLLDYIMIQGGSAGILDATNSTVERRIALINRIRERAGPELNVLFVESLCFDENLLEANMRLKLSGPDYKDKDPLSSLMDFKKRVAIYQRSYEPIGDYEEKNNISYIQFIDVGRKMVSHQIKGFLSAQVVHYLHQFNLAPRQIWITRHGESKDNVTGKIGGDSALSANGVKYGAALAKFINHERRAWEVREAQRAVNTHFPPQPGDMTPPNPYYGEDEEARLAKGFCVWTSMMQRSIQTAQFFDEEDFSIKQMRMLDELNAGVMEGMTYEQIRDAFANEYELRKHDKLHYRYPGPGGEGYLDVINRLRSVISEIERMTEHILLIGHRSVARVLLAYFIGLKREEVADLDVPLGMLYVLEPKPYGVAFKAYRYNADKEWFDLVPDFELRRANTQNADRDQLVS